MNKKLISWFDISNSVVNGDVLATVDLKEFDCNKKMIKIYVVLVNSVINGNVIVQQEADESDCSDLY